MGDNARRTGRIPKHLPEKGFQRISRGPAKARQRRTQHRDSDNSTHIRRGDLVQQVQIRNLAKVFDNVQFSRDPEALNQYFRQMTPTIGSIDFNVFSDAYAALLEKTGPAILVTHSQGGPVGWQTLQKTDNIRAIVAYEPGGGIPFPEGQVPEEGRILTLSGKQEGVEVSMQAFMRYTEIPIVIYYGDNLPETDEHPETYEWTRRLRLMRRWAEMVNSRGGDVTVIHLPDVGLHGNTHFPMSDLNNEDVASLLAEWLHEKGLD